MTLEEAIKHLKDGWVGACFQTAKSMGIASLEKQIPKKLICIDIEKCCPVCKEGICLIGDDGNYGNYCLNCGQALDWSESK